MGVFLLTNHFPNGWAGERAVSGGWVISPCVILHRRVAIWAAHKAEKIIINNDYNSENMSVQEGNIGQMNAGRMERQPGDHPLNSAWSFWYDKKQSRKTDSSEFRNRLHKLGSFDTVEGFWKFYCHLKRPSILDVNVNLYLFRDGENIAPMWEAFPRGGCWILKVKKRKDSGTSGMLAFISL